jgi:hypothetical protein
LCPEGEIEVKGSNIARLGVALAAVAAASAPLLAASHREASGITELPKVDNTDTYAFRSYEPGREDFVTLIANYQPGLDPGSGPNYYTMDPDALYEIHIDNNGDAVEDLTYQFKFTNTLRNDRGVTVNVGGVEQPIAVRFLGTVNDVDDPQLGERETYTVTLVTGDRRSGQRAAITNASGGGTTFVRPLDNVGNKTIPNYGDYAKQFISNITIPGCSRPGRVFSGQRAEYFAVNLGPVFDQVNFIPVQGVPDPVYDGGAPFPAGGTAQSQDNQELIGRKNVATIAIEVPTACVVGNGNGVIGVWATASLPQAVLRKPNTNFAQYEAQGGSFVQVSRLGGPLVNELVIGLPQKNRFNASEPKDDGQFASFVTNPSYPEVLNRLFKDAVNGVLGTNLPTIAPTNFPRNDLVAAFLTGVKTLNQQMTVTPSEMLRLNTRIAPTPRDAQKTLGVLADDLAGFPNGRRPADDVVDIALRVAMGRLCHPVAIGGAQTDLGLCKPADSPVGLAPFTDAAPANATNIKNEFPYLNDPLRGAPLPQNRP